MRRQVLEPATEVTAGVRNHAADFIERLGLAAWIERGPGSSIPIEGHTSGKPEAKDRHSELAIVLADFVSGDGKGREK